MRYKVGWLIRLWSYTCSSKNEQMPSPELNPVFQGKLLRDPFPNCSYIAQKETKKGRERKKGNRKREMCFIIIWSSTFCQPRVFACFPNVGSTGKRRTCWVSSVSLLLLEQMVSHLRLRTIPGGRVHQDLLSSYRAAQTLPGQWAMLPGRAHAQVSTGGFLPHHGF